MNTGGTYGIHKCEKKPVVPIQRARVILGQTLSIAPCMIRTQTELKSLWLNCKLANYLASEDLLWLKDESSPFFVPSGGNTGPDTKLIICRWEIIFGIRELIFTKFGFQMSKGYKYNKHNM